MSQAKVDKHKQEKYNRKKNVNNVVSVNAIEVGVKSMTGKVFKSCNSTSLHEYGFSLEVQDNTNSNKHI